MIKKINLIKNIKKFRKSQLFSKIYKMNKRKVLLLSENM